MNRIGLVGYDWAVTAPVALNPKESAPIVSIRSRLVIMVQLQRGVCDAHSGHGSNGCYTNIYSNIVFQCRLWH